MGINEVTLDFISKFTRTWNEHDLDELMNFMADECIFMASVGNEIDGEKWQGQDQVRRGFASLWEKYPDAHFESIGTDFVVGNRGVAEWIFSGTQASDGIKVVARGCDIFTFKNGKILIKNSMRKQKP